MGAMTAHRQNLPAMSSAEPTNKSLRRRQTAAARAPVVPNPRRCGLSQDRGSGRHGRGACACRTARPRDANAIDSPRSACRAAGVLIYAGQSAPAFRPVVRRSISFTAATIQALRLVVLLDASGSMNLYTAVFVRFVHGILDHFLEADAFLFHTSLVHVSDALREKDAGQGA